MIIRAAMLSLLLTSAALAQDKPPKDQSDNRKENPARGQEDKPRDDTLDKAGDIASQPARDVGIVKTEIPPILQQATEAPYALPASRTCKGLNAAMAELTAALGPDFGTGKENNQNRTGKIMEAGGRAHRRRHCRTPPASRNQHRPRPPRLPARPGHGKRLQDQGVRGFDLPRFPVR
jgi:hypothetical protein